MPKKEDQSKKNRGLLAFVRSILVVTCVFLLSGSLTVWLISESSSAFRGDIEDLLTKQLVREDSVIRANVVDAIYLLGGSQNSLQFKFNRTAMLYHQGICKKILILSRPGKTEFSSLLGRNLTNDEWAIQKLEDLGISKRDVEAVDIKRGFFGTFVEAKCISELVHKRGYKNLIKYRR